MRTLAVIGFGDMGEQMVPHLMQAGYEVRVSEIDENRRNRAAATGATTVEDAAAAASGADIVLGLVMSNDIPAAYQGENGVFAGAGAGTAVLVCSTTTPRMVAALAQSAPEGVTVVDAPIVGGVKYAREAAVTFLVGATETTYNRVEPVLSVLGTPKLVGDFTSGVAYKLITNVAIMAAEAGVREALDLADILGKDYEQALHLMSLGPMAPVVARALDTSNPRPLRRSAEDDDTLLSAVDDPARDLPLSHAGARRLWDAVTANEDIEPDFVDLTRRTTARAPYRNA